MSTKRQDRVIFHSKEDMSAGYNLKKAEKLLDNLDLAVDMEINDLLELYNIKQYFENDLFLLTWDDAAKNSYKVKVAQAEKKIRDFFLIVNDENIFPAIESLDFSYRRAFWHLFNYLQVYNRIKNETFSALLERHAVQIRYILKHLNTVNHFDNELRDFLMGCDEAAELLLSKFEQDDNSREVSYIFPKSLSIADKEDIILRYIDQHEPNLNYIRLIEHSKDSNDLKLSLRTRLKAKKRSEELNDKIFEEGLSWRTGVEITLDRDQGEPVKISHEEYCLKFSYSHRFLDDQPNDVALFMLFRNLFDFTDHTGRITIYNRQSEIGVFERVMMKSKNEYADGMRFRQKNQIAIVQLLSFSHYLSQKGRSIEELIQSFIRLALNNELKIDGLHLRFPSKDSTFLEKIRTMAPELEFLLKQYQIYATEGKIDFELIEIDSSPLKFGDVQSLLERKYAYSKYGKTDILKHHFYSDQSLLHYVEPFNDKYSNLYDLLENEDVKMETFALYQQDIIKQLISEGYLIIDSASNVKMTDDIMMYLIGELHRDEVISYWHFPKEVRQVLDEMEKNGLIDFENTLFSRPEISYYNYYLNKKGYTNGLNIRNKYLHGSNGGSEKEHEFEYYVLLKLLVLAILKIVDDLMLQKSIADENAGL